MTDITLGPACIVALLGYVLVFAGLFALMAVTILFSKFFSAKKAEKAPVVTETAQPAPAVAPGAAGNLKLHNVDPKTAAMIMAIVADKMGKPLNELRFLSIREVSE